MVHFMVAVDESNYARAAFYTAVYTMNKEKDHLYLITVMEHLKTTFPVGYIPPKVQDMVEAQTKNAYRALLIGYAKLCKVMGIKYTCILAISNHIGEMICQQIVSKHIDMLVVGRRGMGTISRMFLGSVSRYVLEHGACNVMVVKGEWGPSEIHVNKTAVVQMEEQERTRRLQEETKERENEEKKRKFESDLDRNIAILAEETERMARIKEDEDFKAKEAQDRVAAHIGAVIDEEEERQRRIREDAIIDDRVHRVEIFEHAF